MSAQNEIDPVRIAFKINFIDNLTDISDMLIKIGRLYADLKLDNDHYWLLREHAQTRAAVLLTGVVYEAVEAGELKKWHHEFCYTLWSGQALTICEGIIECGGTRLSAYEDIERLNSVLSASIEDLKQQQFDAWQAAINTLSE